MSHLMNNYGRLPVSFDHGQGVWLWDKAVSYTHLTLPTTERV